METSMTTTSGSSSSALRHADSPSDASPTTSRSAWASKSDLRPSRTTVWSSASRTRSLFIASPRTGVAQWDAHEEGRAVAGSRLDLEDTADGLDSLLHADQPELRRLARGLGLRLVVEAPAVVLDDNEQLVDV